MWGKREGDETFEDLHRLDGLKKKKKKGGGVLRLRQRHKSLKQEEGKHKKLKKREKKASFHE